MVAAVMGQGYTLRHAATRPFGSVRVLVVGLVRPQTLPAALFFGSHGLGRSMMTGPSSFTSTLKCERSPRTTPAHSMRITYRMTSAWSSRACSAAHAKDVGLLAAHEGVNYLVDQAVIEEGLQAFRGFHVFRGRGQ